MLKHVRVAFWGALGVVSHGEVDAVGGDGDVEELGALILAPFAVCTAFHVPRGHGDRRAMVGEGNASFCFGVVDIGEVGCCFAGRDKFEGGRLVEIPLDVSLAVRHLAQAASAHVVWRRMRRVRRPRKPDAGRSKSEENTDTALWLAVGPRIAQDDLCLIAHADQCAYQLGEKILSVTLFHGGLDDRDDVL